jgi:hypothetical protein
MPNLIRGVFIAVCFLFIFIYFIWYPAIRARIDQALSRIRAEIPPDSLLKIDFHAIKSNGTVFADTFLIFKKVIGKLALLLMGLSAIYCLLAFGLSDLQPQEMMYYSAEPFSIIGSIDPLMTGSIPSFMWLFNGFAFGGIAYFLFWQVREMQPDEADRFFSWFRLIACLSGGLLMGLILQLADGISVLLFVSLFSVIIFWMYTCFQENENPFTGIARSLTLMGSGYWQSLGLLLLTFGTGLIFISLADTALSQFFFELISWIINFDQATMNNISVVLISFLYVFLFYAIMAMLMASFALFYHSRLEALEAHKLGERLQNFGNSKQIRGMERE